MEQLCLCVMFVVECLYQHFQAILLSIFGRIHHAMGGWLAHDAPVLTLAVFTPNNIWLLALPLLQFSSIVTLANIYFQSQHDR